MASSAMAQHTIELGAAGVANVGLDYEDLGLCDMTRGCTSGAPHRGVAAYAAVATLS